MHATLIAEDFAGMWSQGRGLAERAGFSWEKQPVIMRQNDLLQYLPTKFWPSPLRRVEPFALSPHTDVIISMGGRGGVIGAAVGQKYQRPVIQIQNPRISLKQYTLVIASIHDRLQGDNVFSVRTALHGMTDTVLAEARQEWHEVIKRGPQPVLGVLLGGSNGRFRFGVDEAYNMAEQLSTFIQRRHMACVVTPSRRTSADALTVLKDKLRPLGVRFLEGTGEENPYKGILACADMLAVTTDSVSMISEAVATSAPVGILPLSGHSSRIAHFIALLQKEGRVQSFSVNLPLKQMEKLDDTALAVEEIHRYLMS